MQILTFLVSDESEHAWSIIWPLFFFILPLQNQHKIPWSCLIQKQCSCLPAPDPGTSHFFREVMQQNTDPICSDHWYTSYHEIMTSQKSPWNNKRTSHPSSECTEMLRPSRKHKIAFTLLVILRVSAGSLTIHTVLFRQYSPSYPLC